MPPSRVVAKKSSSPSKRSLARILASLKKGILSEVKKLAPVRSKTSAVSCEISCRDFSSPNASRRLRVT